MLYAITNRKSYGNDEAQARQRLLAQVAIWAVNGVRFIQLREKDLSARDQVEIARAMMEIVRTEGDATAPEQRTRLLVNGRADVALAAGADGVHLPSGGTLTPLEVRQVFAAAGKHAAPTIGMSCHSIEEVSAARSANPDCVLFAPVFEKVLVSPEDGEGKSRVLPGVGLERLQQACQSAAPVPVFALGGVTAENATSCLEAGAAGIAAIRWLQEPPAAWRRFSR